MEEFLKLARRDVTLLTIINTHISLHNVFFMMPTSILTQTDLYTYCIFISYPSIDCMLDFSEALYCYPVLKMRLA